MKFYCYSVTIACIISTGALGQGQVLRETLLHRNVQRSYNLYVPSTYSGDGDTPLVLNMHGFGGTADQQMASSAMNAVAEQNGFIVVYPNAVNRSWNIGTDLGFIESLLQAIDLEYSIDPRRTYSTGYSQGGIMSYRLAAARPDTFAAIAPVAGHAAAGIPRRPFPVMHIHGTGDAVVPVDGSTSVLGDVFPILDGYLKTRASRNGCDLTQAVSELPNISLADESTVSVLSFDGCDTYTSAKGEEIVASVLYYRVDGGGHSWPVLEADRLASLTALEEAYGADALPVFHPLNSDFNASEEIWSFFEQHTVPVPESDGLSLGLLSVLGMAALRHRSK